MSGTTIENTGAVSDTFESRKRKILADLSIPDEEYTDLSPKGSVDEGIQGLIQDINALPGLVTTSSCAGRISVFLEGRKKQAQKPPQQQQKQFAPSGGKGAGRWLYVSHNPLEDTRSLSGEANAKSLHEMFGLVSGDGKPPKLKGEEGQAPRLVRFHFDPMVRFFFRSLVKECFRVLLQTPNDTWFSVSTANVANNRSCTSWLPHSNEPSRFCQQHLARVSEKVAYKVSVAWMKTVKG